MRRRWSYQRGEIQSSNRNYLKHIWNGRHLYKMCHQHLEIKLTLATEYYLDFIIFYLFIYSCFIAKLQISKRREKSILKFRHDKDSHIIIWIYDRSGQDNTRRVIQWVLQPWTTEKDGKRVWESSSNSALTWQQSIHYMTDGTLIGQDPIGLATSSICGFWK